jgi:uncharacterized protein YecE (DUF72 family)
MNLYTGTSGYQYKEWKGSFYPEDLPLKRMLSYYAERLPAVESNYTFRGIPAKSVLEGWTGHVPDEFRFALKAPQQITHFRRLKDAGELVASFFDVARVLGARQGPVLFQLPPTFRKDTARLKTFLAELPKKCRAAVEFRHASWFDDEVFALLRKHRVALCVAEEDDDLVVPRVGTADWGYVRLRQTNYGDKELKSWAKWVREQDWSDAYVFFMHEETGTGPKYAERFLKMAE